MSFGIPFGSSGSIAVNRALAVAGQTCRVVFSGEPLHRSAAGDLDALNPGNYVFSIDIGQATAPVAVGVSPAIVPPVSWGVGNGTDPAVALERGVDVFTDRQLVAGIVYRVTAQSIVAQAGGFLAEPTSAAFRGVTDLRVVRLPERPIDLIDIANPPAVGHWLADTGGDIAREAADAGTKKRIMRRFATRRGAFKALPDYGLGFSLKSVTSIRQLTLWKADAAKQVAKEPDVASVGLNVTLNPLDLVIVEVFAKTKRKTQLNFSARFVAGLLAA